MNTQWALNLYVSAETTNGRFDSYTAGSIPSGILPPNSTPMSSFTTQPTGRVWWNQVPPWTAGNWLFQGNADDVKNTPKLEAGDQMVVAVIGPPLITGNPLITKCHIVALFARDRNNPKAATLGSPFKNAATSPTPLCMFGHSNPATKSGPDNWVMAGFPTLPNPLPSGGSLKGRYRFMVVARVTFSDGTVTDYGYDPDMDVDV